MQAERQPRQAPRQAETQARPAPHEVDHSDGLRPEIWVGATSDYEGEQRYGRWLDAAQDPAQLQAQILQIIDRTPDRLRQSWHIHDVRGFGWWDPAKRYGLPTVHRIAIGIKRYGLPYSALVELVGAETEAARIDRFEDAYLGNWASLSAFVEQFVEQAGWRRRIEQLPEDMRRYVDLNTERMARAVRRDLVVVEHSDGMWLFHPRHFPVPDRRENE